MTTQEPSTEAKPKHTKTKARAPISLTMIVKNETSGLERCLRSIREHVEEICIVDTGSTDDTPEIAKRYADKFEVFTDCNGPDGKIASFALARNRALSLANQPWAMWLDGDDEVHGAEKLSALVLPPFPHAGNAQIHLPYELMNAEGVCTLRYERERLVRLTRSPSSSSSSNSNSSLNYCWTGRVHEVLIPMPGIVAPIVRSSDVIVRHVREGSGKTPEVKRNLRILQDMVEREGNREMRNLYYLAREYADHMNLAASIRTFRMYLAIGTWDEERCLAWMRMGEMYLQLQDYDAALDCASRAMWTMETWGEPYFLLCKIFYFMARRGVDSWRSWQRCAFFGQAGLALPETKTGVFIDPFQRTLEVHRYLTCGLYETGKIKEALISVEAALKTAPTDPQLLQNHALYREKLGLDCVVPS